jgi:indole-3-glycerol phosphate synthase
MSDILKKIVEVKRQEVAGALKRKPLHAMRADAESRVLTRDFVGAMRAKIAQGLPAVIAEVKKARAKLCRAWCGVLVGAY